MSTFSLPESYIARKLTEVPANQRAKRRLELDIAAILTGPTSGGRAAELAESLLRANTPSSVAKALAAAGARYLRSKK